jgi:hypothetical protein
MRGTHTIFEIELDILFLIVSSFETERMLKKQNVWTRYVRTDTQHQVMAMFVNEGVESHAT